MTNVNQNWYWKCPLCSLKFKYFEVLDDDKHTSESLAPHLYLVHEKELHQVEVYKI